MAGWIRRAFAAESRGRLPRRWTIIATCALSVGGAVAVPTAASAAPPAPGYYMLVNSAYPDKCLSANNSTPPGGTAGTFTAYLTNCNSATLAQWWLLPPQSSFGRMDQAQVFPGGTSHCLSTNLSTPPGGTAGTHAAYTARCSDFTDYQRWTRMTLTARPYEVRLRNAGASSWCLSASSSNPYTGGGYRVYTSLCGNNPAASYWRPWQP